MILRSTVSGSWLPHTNTYILTSLDKPLRWVGSSHADLRAFPEVARRRAGYQLRRVQEGLAPDDWRPMPSVGPGVAEIRIHADGEHRVLYLARFEEAIYVLHAFVKHSRRTRSLDLELGRKRLSDVIRLRRGG